MQPESPRPARDGQPLKDTSLADTISQPKSAREDTETPPATLHAGPPGEFPQGESPPGESPSGEIPPGEFSPGDSPSGEAVAAAVFAEGAAPLPVPPRPAPPRPVGPGFWESIGWLIGIPVVQAIAFVVAGAGLAALVLMMRPSATGTLDVSAITRETGPFIEKHFAVILGAAGMATVFYGAAAVSLRLRRQGGLRSLGLHAPSPVHLALVALGMLPLSLLCTELQKTIFGFYPNSQEDYMQLFEHLGDAPLLQLLWGIALAPALGEELIFRGLIGRGLIARRGVFSGMMVTSILFGLLHLNPAQALAVIPLGFAMHFAYLTTRSFWSPVLLHLLNNGFAVLLLKYGEEWQLAKLLDGDQSAPLQLMTVSAAMLMALGLLLWQTRVRFTTPDGAPMPDPWTGAGGVPESPSLAVCQPPRPLLLAYGAFNLLGFVGVIWQLAAAL
jgi:membrane protease YdiL (CAAX protease family)